ncbi:NAD(P)H-dependent oxidoreductase [Convivina praedatoris]|uniref:FMN-dependent NADH-azoreductase n=1 Tax=Convivina praedatoris TaxID=2880963 RepID=A0ABM9D2H5_9LACO|nr:NAD(P)H-dependent oxidoreductase [Convivina sp. LMG 32447]CAH1852095.1 FMN-dependent NADH-azoreductase [Convivina sp. LMG 32447]CAH1852120.1 FMN-dependent NADH-azoreductase [Convivina sp. LMG 32447]CAH1852811.1 FMN-dependent NADH-azoreductase [Convivina sp. LMG 32447]
MSYLIVYCHPYPNSFNHAILRSVCNNLRNKGADLKVIDLYRDQFNPIYSVEELRLFSSGETVDPLIQEYWNLLTKAKTIIFITPVWWNDIPGMLKGFIDKVMKQNKAYTVGKLGLKGNLSNIKHCYLLTTSTSPTFYLRFLMGNAVQGVFLNKTLKQLGFQHRRWQNFGMISTAKKQRLTQYLHQLSCQSFK